MSVGRLGLRARLVAAFVGIAALAVLVAALLTGWGLHRTFDDYLARRSDQAGRDAVALAETAYATAGGRWSADALDILSHELVLTGYDYRLREGGRVLIDTTKLDRDGLDFRRVSELPVHGPRGGRVATLELYALGADGDTPADEELRQELDQGHLLAAAIAAVVAIGAGLVVAGRLSRPLRRLTVAARGLAAGGRTPELPGASAEVRELAEALDGLSADLERQRRARRQLAADLSHELRTPLMLLQGRIEAMQDGVVPFDADGLAALHTETLRLSRLIGQIERLAESEAQPSPLRVGVVALDEVAAQVHASLAAAFEIRGLALEVDARPARAAGDPDAVRQIAVNLLSNALKYAPPAGAVRLGTALDDGWATMRVHDDGDPAALDPDRIFERFHRGSEAAWTSGGEGLGLAIARELAEAQGGSLELEPSGGTCFVLRLPAASGAASGRTQAAPTARAPKG
ncbi:sensor histidine kinase [Miltoncostaea marina]|uniref:sensor histidine kinase n=1 Tax=Miltoncostaea marina TaxID=2843215 RepID=UPI001C3E0B66|nr:HAMP domain-containing sensor histidine kinase [Miltoncostaea marina]